MKIGETTTVIGVSVTIHGDVTGAEDLRIEGEVHGTVRVPGSRLTITETARVKANLIAEEVIVAGRLDGSIWATGRVELRGSAVVRGDIFAGRLSIEENAALRGNVDPSRAHDAPPTALDGPSASVPAAMTSGEPRPSIMLVPESVQLSGEANRSATLPAGLAAAAAVVQRNTEVDRSASEKSDAAALDAPLFVETKAE